MTPETLAKRIDYTFLKPLFTWKEFEVFLEKGKSYPFRGLCIPPFLVKRVRTLYEGTLISVAGFPLGFQSPIAKAREVETLLEEGADEVDFVVNLALIKNRDSKSLLEELRLIRKVSSGRVIKAIIETPLLEKEDISFVLPLLIEANLDFVKTSTGFFGKGTTLEEVLYLKELSQKKIKIKASGGIRTLEEALSFLEAGTEVLGTSSGYEILKELESEGFNKEEAREEESEEVHIFADGCSLGNPGPGGFAAIIRKGKEEKIITGGEAYTTNNRMELRAVIEALKALEKPSKVKVFCDSEYVIKGATVWLPSWKKRGFRTADGGKVKNQELWLELEKWLNFHRVSFEKVPAHAGHPENERVDKLAKREAAKWKKGIS